MSIAASSPDEILKEPIAVTEQDPYPIGQRLFIHDERLTGLIVRNLHRRIRERKEAGGRGLNATVSRAAPHSQSTTAVSERNSAERPAANGEMSIGAGRPATRSATILPVIGAEVMPTWPWPKA